VLVQFDFQKHFDVGASPCACPVSGDRGDSPTNELRMPQPIVNVLFDLDGTLTDPREGIVGCFKHTLLELGYCAPPDSDLERYIGPPLREGFASLLGSERHEQIDLAVGLYRQRFSERGIFENAIYPGIHSALAQLDVMGAALYVATSKSRVFAERIVEHFGLKVYFRAIYGSELDGTRSDKGELIAHILEKESLSARSTFMVGDRAHDVIGAKTNGIFPIGALWGHGTREELSAAGATAFSEQPEMLIEILLSNIGILPASTSDRR
jgi:phosphoglycolate phosphatase